MDVVTALKLQELERRTNDLTTILELIYGLLWSDRHMEARRTLAIKLDQVSRKRGIEQARQVVPKDVLPRAISQAANILRETDRYVMLQGTMRPEDGESLQLRARAAAMQLERWGAGITDEEGGP